MKRSHKMGKMHEAVMLNDLTAVKILAEQDEPVDELDREGRTPLFYAIQNGSLPLAAELISLGANVNAQDNNLEGPLHFAARAYNLEATKLLIDHGAEVDLKDRQGNTPLSNAVFESRGREPVIKYLLQSGADRSAKNNHGVSPEELANSIANYDISKFFT